MPKLQSHPKDLSNPSSYKSIAIAAATTTKLEVAKSKAPAPFVLCCAGSVCPELKPERVLLGPLEEKVLLLAALALVNSVEAASVTPAAMVAFVGMPVITPLLSVSVR